MIRKYIKKEIAYLKDNPEGYWFKRKLYGWGWTPATREGWLVTLGFLIMVLALTFNIDNNSSSEQVIFGFVVPVWFLIFVFIFIAYKKGEKLRWQWGVKDKTQE